MCILKTMMFGCCANHNGDKVRKGDWFFNLSVPYDSYMFGFIRIECFTDSRGNDGCHHLWLLGKVGYSKFQVPSHKVVMTSLDSSGFLAVYEWIFCYFSITSGVTTDYFINSAWLSQVVIENMGCLCMMCCSDLIGSFRLLDGIINTSCQYLWVLHEVNDNLWTLIIPPR